MLGSKGGQAEGIKGLNQNINLLSSKSRRETHDISIQGCWLAQDCQSKLVNSSRGGQCSKAKSHDTQYIANRFGQQEKRQYASRGTF